MPPVNTVAALVILASDGDQRALETLMAMAIGENTFIARTARRALWTNFGIKVDDTQAEAEAVR